MEEQNELKKLRKDRSKAKGSVGKAETSGKTSNVRFLIVLIAALVVALCAGVTWVVNTKNVETVGIHKAKALG